MDTRIIDTVLRVPELVGARKTGPEPYTQITDLWMSTRILCYPVPFPSSSLY